MPKVPTDIQTVGHDLKVDQERNFDGSQKCLSYYTVLTIIINDFNIMLINGNLNRTKFGCSREN